MHNHDSGSTLVTGLAVGVIAGVAIGLMLAPKPGSEARELVRQGIARGVELIRSRSNHGAAEEE